MVVLVRRADHHGTRGRIEEPRIGAEVVAMILVGRALGLHKRRWPATLNVAGMFAAVALVLYVMAPLAGVIAGKFHGVATPPEQVTPGGRYTSAANIVLEHGGTGELSYSVLIPRGFHPVAACPGYTLNYSWFLAGEGRVYGAWRDDPRHAWIKH